MSLMEVGKSYSAWAGLQSRCIRSRLVCCEWVDTKHLDLTVFYPFFSEAGEIHVKEEEHTKIYIE